MKDLNKAVIDLANELVSHDYVVLHTLGLVK